MIICGEQTDRTTRSVISSGSFPSANIQTITCVVHVNMCIVLAQKKSIFMNELRITIVQLIEVSFESADVLCWLH